MTIKLQLDNTGYKQKPTSEYSRIKPRVQNSEPIDISIADLLDKLAQGHTVSPAVMNGTKASEWAQQQLFLVDVDSDKKNPAPLLTVDKAIEICKTNQLPLCFYYYTFSHTENNPRFRLGFVMDTVITELIKRKTIVEVLLTLFPNADKACKNADRIFLGSNTKPCLVDENAVVSFADIARLYVPKISTKPAYAESKDSQLEQLKAEFDFLGYLKLHNGEVHKDSGDTTMFKHCEVCGHHDDLVYYKSSNSFYCFSSSGACGGSIVDYIIATKHISRKEAIEYFKYDLCSIPRLDDKIKYIKQTQLEQVKKQVSIPLDMTELPYITHDTLDRNGNPKPKVITTALYEFIRNNSDYRFVKDGALGSTLIYWYDREKGYYRQINDNELKGYIKSYIPISCQIVKDITEVYTLLMTDLQTISISDLDNDENIINFQNGLLHLDTMQLTAHTPAILSTIQIPANYNPTHIRPIDSVFDRFMNDFTQDDNEIKTLLMQFLGVCISNVSGHRFKKALLMQGKGNTGKSQLRNLATKLIGEANNSSIGLDEMEERFGTSALVGKRLAGSADMSYASVRELKTFKSITGGDPLMVEYKGKNSFNYTYKGLLWFCCNELPKFGGDTGDWVYDRMIIVNCDNQIAEEKQDKLLLDKMYAEREYIISLAIAHLTQVIDNGYVFSVPDKCIQARSKYKVDNDSLLTFVEECCMERPNGKISDNCTKSTLMKVYQAWCKDNNKGYYLTKQQAHKRLEEIGRGRVKKTNGIDYYSDFTLTMDTKNDYGQVYGYDGVSS